jgi:hypothetical protein
MHTTNILKTILNIFLEKKKTFKVLKMCFSMDLFNIKIMFLHFGFYNMFVNSKGYWSIFKKYKNLIFGEFIFIHY